MKLHEIEHLGGRCLEDIQQYWWSLGSMIRDNYKMNEVPTVLASGYDSIERKVNALMEEQINFVNLVHEHLKEI